MARASAVLRKTMKAVPRLWPREQYIRQVAGLFGAAKTLSWSRPFLQRQLYLLRRRAWARQRRLGNPIEWVMSWDRQAGKLLRYMPPEKVAGVMYIQAGDRQRRRA